MEKQSKYLNQYHKESTERKLKAIQEMRKSPVNYKEELASHTKMLADFNRERALIAKQDG